MKYTGMFLRLAVFSVLLLLLACSGNTKIDKEDSSAVQDTTPLGLKITELSLQISKDPDNPELFHQRALLHMQRKDVANAMIDMEKVLQMDTTNAAYFITLADVHLAAGKPGKSMSALDKCRSIDPKNKLAYEKKAELFFIAQQYKQAISNLDEVLKLDITNPKAYFMKGMCFRDLGDTLKAVSSFQTSIEQKPDYYDAYLQLAMIWHARNNVLAKQYYDGALRVNPKSVDALYGRGLWFQENEQNYDLAIQDYTSAIQLDPTAARAHYALGYLHYQYLKVYAQAIKHYTDAIKVDKEWAEAYFNRGLAYEASGNVSAANADYEMALQINPAYQNAAQALGRVVRPSTTAAEK